LTDTLMRMRQGLRALFAFSLPVDRDLAAEYLSPDLLALFDALNRGERYHSLNVLRQVLADGPTPRELAIAALLHDAGKSRYSMNVWQKTLSVLVKKLLPGAYARWSAADPAVHPWARPYVVREQHPAWSAALARAAGAPEAAVWLIEHHAEPASQWEGHPLVPLLRRLQASDDAN
jgi:hypothetical protein